MGKARIVTYALLLTIALASVGYAPGQEPRRRREREWGMKPADGAGDATQQPGPDPIAVVKRLVERFRGGDQYTFDATLELARRDGDGGRETVAAEWVKLAVAPKGRYLFWAGDAPHLKFLVASNGRSTWAYSPGTREYLLIEAAGADLHRTPGDAYRRGVRDDDRDLMAAAELVVPILRDMDREAAVVEMNRYLDAQLRGEEQQVPVLSVLSGISPDGSQRRTEIALDPETADLVDLSWSKSTQVEDEQRFALLNAKVDRFKSGSILPATFFEFNPPGDAKRVDELPIPGLTGSSILNRTAPGFTLEAPGAQTSVSPRSRDGR